jgi:hypothetical protein
LIGTKNCNGKSTYGPGRGSCNECFLDLRVREQREGARWREARDESFCVWDLEVIWHERNAYVEHMLKPATARPDRYLVDFLDR